MTIVGYLGCGMHFGVFKEGTEARSQLSEKDLSVKELSEHPWKTVTPMPKRGGSKHFFLCLGHGLLMIPLVPIDAGILKCTGLSFYIIATSILPAGVLE